MNQKYLWGVLVALAPTVSVSEEIKNEDTIVVTANRFEEPLSSTLSPTIVITSDQIQKLQASNLVDVVRTLPGIDVYVTGGRGQSSTVQTRGGSAADTLILINGIKVNSAYTGSKQLEQIPVNQIERIEYIRGVKASIYGSQASAAVVNIITRPDFNQNNIHAIAKYGSYKNRQGNISFKHSVGDNGEFKIAAGTEKEKGYNVHPVEGLNDSDHHGYEASNLMLDYQHKIGDFTIYGDFNWNQSKGQFDSSYLSSYYGDYHEYDMNWFESYTYQLGAKYNTELYRSDLNLSYQKNDDYEQIQLNPYKEGRSKNTPIYIRTTSVSWVNEIAASEYFTLGGGVDYKRDHLLKKSKVYYQNIKANHPLNHNTGVYLIGQSEIGNIQSEVSGRYDHNTQFGGHYTYQVGTAYTFLDDYKASLRYGSSYRAPTFSELYYPGYENFRLKPETSNSVEFMLQGKNNLLDWRLSLYKNHYKDKIVFLYNSTTWMGSYQNINRADIKGIEAEVGFDLLGIHNAISGEIKSPKNKTTDTDIPYVSRRSFKWTASGSIQDFDVALTMQAFSSRFNSAYKPRLGGYSLWNLAVGYNITENFKLLAAANNIFDKKYALADGYRPPEATYSVGFEFDY